MSERTFRAVVASILVGALALAVAVAFAVLQPPSPKPTPGVTPTTRPTATALPTPTPTPRVVFGDVGVTSVGSVPRGGASATTLVLRFLEPGKDAIPDGAGSLTVLLTDHAGADTTLAFTGTPTIVAPGSLGVKVERNGGGLLRISILGADDMNVELITVSGLGIRATPDAALGPINATLGAFDGSLAGGVANPSLSSPGTVVAGP